MRALDIEWKEKGGVRPPATTGGADCMPVGLLFIENRRAITSRWKCLFICPYSLLLFSLKELAISFNKSWIQSQGLDATKFDEEITP